MACDIPGSSDCNDHAPAGLNLFIPVLLVCVLFALGAGMICRRFGFMGRRPVAGGLAFDLDDSFQFDNGPNFGETPKIYDFSMMRNIGGDASAHWAALLPISAHHIGDPQGIQNQEKIGTAAVSSPQLPTSVHLRRFWEPKPSNRLSEEQQSAEQPVDVSPQPVSTSILITMPRYGKVSPNAESEGLPDIVLGIAEVHCNASASAAYDKHVEQPALPDIDPSKLTITRAEPHALKTIPPPETWVFGQSGSTDHMLVIEHDPETGWSAPIIKPYSPLTLDPASSVFHYATAVFEGMKAFRGADGKPTLFRPEMNMDRFEKSAERIALPTFNNGALLTLIKQLVLVDERWIPSRTGYSMYVRPVYIGTRPTVGVQASTHGMIFVIMSPTGPYFPTGFKPISLMARHDYVRAWPGGTGEYKLALNYAPTFKPQQEAASQGYQQILWLLGDERRVTEVGQMNFFVVLRRGDGGVDLITPALDGTILPGVTRDCILSLGKTHVPDASSPSSLSTSTRPIPQLHPQERSFTISDIVSWLEQGVLLEAFGTGTASIICPVSKIGWEGKDLVLPEYEEGVGPVSKALWERIVEIQEGRRESEWSVKCE